MEERGTAVGFSETKEKEGVGPVGVGNRVPLELTEPLAATVPTEEAAEEVAEEAAEAATVDVTEEAI
jgi:hypothetical protein